jgi:putative ABC transport system permease protein
MFNFLLETFRLALKNLRLHKLRSLLTALGIIFGVAAVIIMVAMGEGAKQEALEQISQLGARNILVKSRPPPESSDNTSRSTSTAYGLKRADLARLQTLPDVEAIVPLRNTEQKVVRNDVRVAADAIGTTPDVFDVINLRLARGAYFDKLQYDRAESVCVIGHRAADQLFPSQDPLGQTVKVGSSGGSGSAMLTVIGVLEPTGLRAGTAGATMMGHDPDMSLYFPLTLAEDTFGDTIITRSGVNRTIKQIELSFVWMKAKTIADVEPLAAAAENAVGYTQRAGPQDLSNNPRPDVQVDAPIQILRTAERQQRTFNFIMVGIAGFSLVVGGIGIMNIMLATVTERTREVGIRRALGAKRRHITLQFLIETTVISLAGGVIGIAFGCGGAKVLPAIVALLDPSERYVTAIAAWSVIGSFAVSGLIGVGFGLYPAMKAAWMNPIEALRHE